MLRKGQRERHALEFAKVIRSTYGKASPNPDVVAEEALALADALIKKLE